MLLARVSVRARAMELLARAAGLDKPRQEAAFMAGMFSLLGVLFGMPLAEVLQPLNVGDEIGRAVLRREGELGCLLAAVEDAEAREPAAMAAHLAGFAVADIPADRLLVEAHGWMLELVRPAVEPGCD
jgi:EAL and modified HD-GYP domain-containing signal transduction protein